MSRPLMLNSASAAPNAGDLPVAAAAADRVADMNNPYDVDWKSLQDILGGVLIPAVSLTDIDWKPSCRLASTGNLSLMGAGTANLGSAVASHGNDTGQDPIAVTYDLGTEDATTCALGWDPARQANGSKVRCGWDMDLSHIPVGVTATVGQLVVRHQGASVALNAQCRSSASPIHGTAAATLWAALGTGTVIDTKTIGTAAGLVGWTMDAATLAQISARAGTSTPLTLGLRSTTEGAGGLVSINSDQVTAAVIDPPALYLTYTVYVDGVAVVVNDRILAKNQTTPSQNGIYVASAGTWVRADDADSGTELTCGATSYVEEGTSNAQTLWTLTTNNPITIGATSQTWSPTNSTIAKTILLRGLAAARPAAAAGNAGFYYYATDTFALSQSDGAAWNAMVPLTGSSLAQIVETNGGVLDFGFGIDFNGNALQGAALPGVGGGSAPGSVGLFGFDNSYASVFAWADDNPVWRAVVDMAYGTGGTLSTGLPDHEGFPCIFKLPAGPYPIDFNGQVLLNAAIDGSLTGVLARANGGTNNIYGDANARASTSVPAGNTVANTVTETAFNSTFNIGADRLAAGDVVRLTLYGVYSTALVAPTLRGRIKLGGVTFLDTGVLTTLVGSAANAGWRAEALFIVQTDGAGGTVEAQGLAQFSTGLGLGFPAHVSNTAAIGLDTTSGQALTVTVQWGTASASNTITLRSFVAEVLKAN